MVRLSMGPAGNSLYLSDCNRMGLTPEIRAVQDGGLQLRVAVET